MKIFFFSKTHKSVCIMLISMPGGISLEMQDLFFPKVSLSIAFFFLVVAKVFFLTFLVRTRPLPCSHSQRAIGRPWVGNYASNCSLLLSPNAHKCRASTTHCIHSKVSKPSDAKKTKQYLLHSLAMIPGELFVWKCFLSYRLLQFSFSKWKCWSWV